MRTHSYRALLAASGLIASVSQGHAAVVFSENFNALSEGDSVTSPNTNFTASSGAGQTGNFSLARDGSTTGDLFDGSSYAELSDQGANSVRLEATLGAATNLMSIRLAFNEDSASQGVGRFVLRAATGGSVNSTEAGIDFRLEDGSLYSDSVTVGSGVYLEDTSYFLDIVGNANASGSVSYTDPNGVTQSLAAQTYDVWISNYDLSSVVASAQGIAFRNTVSDLDLFYITTFSGDDSVQMFYDDLEVRDSLETVIVPEPGVALLGGIGLLALLRRRR